MGRGRQVADAYIEVHGDLKPFREDLDKANGGMEKWAKDNADGLTKAWGQRMRSGMDRQWNSVIDAMHSGEKIDFNRMIDNFDSTDLVGAFSDIDDMLQTLQRNGKLTAKEMDRMSTSIAKQVEVMEKAKVSEEMWGNAHRKMMAERSVVLAKQKKDLVEAFAMNARFDAARRKMAKDEMALNVRLADARKKQFEEAIRDNTAWANSFKGVVREAGKIDLERKFRNIGTAMATNDWSRIAQGAKNMDELRVRTTQTTREMVKLGRMTEEQFAGVQERLQNVSADLGGFNVKFAESNKASGRQARDWTIIQRMVGNAAAKFKGFSGLNVVGDVFREGAQFFQDLDRNAVKIGKMALMIGALGSAVTNLIGSLAVVGQDLAKLAQISIAGSAFLVAAGIQAGVLMAALKDMDTVLADLKPAFAGLQDTISAKFWDKAAQPIRDMVNTLLPTLETKLGETATAMGGVFAQMADSLGSLNQDDIGTMFDRMNSGITIATGAVDPLIQAFQTLGMVGSEYFERFGTWIVDLSTKFNDFIQGAAADGRLNLWIEEAIQGFKDVWSILGSTVGIFNAVGNAAEAAGIGGLSVMAANMEKVSAIMNSAGFQTTLTQLFTGAADATRSIGTALYELGPAITSFMPTLSAGLGTIGDTVATLIGYIGQVLSNPIFQQGLTDFLAGVQSGVEALGPAIGPMAASLGQIGTLLGQVAGIVGTLVAAMATQLSPILDVVTAAFGRITFAAGPEIEKIIGTIGEVLGTFVSTLLPPLENLIMTILPLLAPAFEALVPIATAVQGAMKPFIEGISSLVAMIAPVLIPAIEKISEAMAPVIEVIGVLVGAIMTVLVPILGSLLIGAINAVVGVFEGFGNIVMGIVNMVTGVFNGFRDIFVGIFTGDFGMALDGLATVFSSIFNGINQFLLGILQVLWNGVQLLFVGKLIGGIKTALTGIGAFFKTTWDDIAKFLSNIWPRLANIVGNGITTAKNFVSNGLTAMVKFFTDGWSKMSGATTTGINTVLGWVRGIPGKITGALGDLGGLLLRAGKAIIDGFLRGLKNAWGAVKDFVGGIGDWIARNKGPLPYDRALLIPAGNAIMEGLGQGLEDKLGMLKNTLNTVTDTMTDTVTAAFAKNKMYLAGADAALGLADGLKSNKNVVTDALSAVMPSAAATSVSANLTTTRTAASGGVGTTTPTAGIVIESGAIVVSTPTKNPEIVATKVIDEFANFSNL